MIDANCDKLQLKPDVRSQPVDWQAYPLLSAPEEGKGVSVKDWCLSEDFKWVLPHDQMGLSFSSTFKNLKQVYKLKERHNPGKRLDVYWVLEQANLPADLTFEPDRNKKGHNF